MVALKPVTVILTVGVTPRSRNAVVALKHASGRRETISEREKQERRGGIETKLLEGIKNTIGMKQERRGGIETWGGPRAGGTLPGGSRNAVVALKLLCGGFIPAADREAGTPWWH